VSAMGESSVDFKLYIWADAVKRVYVISDVLKTVYDTLRANGVEIPFPQRDVHLITPATAGEVRATRSET